MSCSETFTTSRYVQEEEKEVMSSGQHKTHRGFNSVQIKNGMIVRLNKNGTIRAILGKYGEYGKAVGTYAGLQAALTYIDRLLKQNEEDGEEF